MRVFRLGDRLVDTIACRVTSEGETIGLTPLEARLLVYLAHRTGQVVGRDELLSEVWGYRAGVRSRTIDNTSSRLRKKIETDPNNPQFLLASYGQGLSLRGAELFHRPARRELTRFIGREWALDAIVEAFQNDGRRLVTLWGPGGAGKTRVMTEVLPRLGLDSAVVDCRAVYDAPERAIGAALGLEPSQQLTFDRYGPFLLVLDECERSIEALRGCVARWLSDAPALRILVTSRIVLGLGGEQRIAVGPLDEAEACELFLDRARSQERRFDASREDLGPLVSRVDRLPLAIELMAERAHLLGAARLGALLDGPFEVLEGRISMASVLDRSFGLLSAEDRRVLECASLFEAPFELEDLAQVAGLQRAGALRSVESLLCQSLLQVRDDDGQRRFALYTVVSERARAGLSPEDPAGLRYARWLARLGEPASLFASRSLPAERARIRRSQPDLRRALSLALPLEPDTAARCALALVWHMDGDGSVREIGEILDRLEGVGCDDLLRTALGVVAVRRQMGMGQVQTALELAQASLARSTDPDLTLWLRGLSAHFYAKAGDTENMDREMTNGAALLPAATYLRAWWSLCAAERAHGPEAQERGYREALLVARRTGDLATEAVIHACMGHLAATRADWDSARRALRSAVRLNEQLGTQSGGVHWLSGLLAVQQGDLDEAEEWLTEAIAYGRATGRTYLRELAQVALAAAWALRGWHEEAIELAEPIASGRGDGSAVGEAALVLAKIAERREQRGVARRFAQQALDIARRRVGEIVEVEALELIAVLDHDPAVLARAAELSTSPLEIGRRHALASLIASHRGEAALAQAEFDQAKSRLAALDLLSGADAMHWLNRAEQALAAGAEQG